MQRCSMGLRSAQMRRLRAVWRRARLGVFSSNSSFSDYIGGLTKIRPTPSARMPPTPRGRRTALSRGFVTGNSTPSRLTMRLLQGFRIKLVSGRIILQQK